MSLLTYVMIDNITLGIMYFLNVMLMIIIREHLVTSGISAFEYNVQREISGWVVVPLNYAQK